MKQTLLLLLLLSSATAVSQVYQRTDPDGQVHFSDRPGPDAEPIDVRPVQTIRVPPSPLQKPQLQSGEPTAKPAEDSPAYATLTFISPTNGEEVRANDGNVVVRLSLRPALMSGHTIALTVTGEDGEQTKSLRQMDARLTNLSRGQHTLSAQVLDDKGNALIGASPVSFQVLRAAAHKSAR